MTASLTCISLYGYMDFSKLIYGYVLVVTWIRQTFFYGFAKWICQTCYMFFSPFAEQIQVLKLIDWGFWYLRTMGPWVCCVFGNFLTKRTLTKTLNAWSYLEFWLESLNLIFSGKNPGLCWSPFPIKSLANFKKKASVDDKNSLNDNHRLKNTFEA